MDCRSDFLGVFNQVGTLYFIKSLSQIIVKKNSQFFPKKQRPHSCGPRNLQAEAMIGKTYVVGILNELIDPCPAAIFYLFLYRKFALKILWWSLRWDLFCFCFPTIQSRLVQLPMAHPGFGLLISIFPVF